MKFYRTCMRNASQILFWVAVVVFFATALVYLRNDYSSYVGTSAQFDNKELARIASIALALTSALSTAAWPFFGAALLWVIDRKLPDAGAAE